MKNTNPSTPKLPHSRPDNAPAPKETNKGLVNESPQELLRKEITKLKEIARSVEAQAENDLPLSDLVRLLEVRGKTSTRIASLLKAERQLSESNDTMDAFYQALDEVIKELEKD
jgi:vacuolar-type H+-ATPase subunit I/STV1